MRKIIIIVIGSLLSIAVLVVAWECIYVKTTTMQKVYILPQGFRGVVLIAYAQKDGLEDVKEDGKLIYRIPESGVLKLKRKAASPLSQSWYYFEDDQGRKTEFYYCFDPKKMRENKDKVYAFGGSYREFENNGEKVKFDIFFVGSEKNRDSLSKLDEKMNPLELIKRN